MKEHKLEGTASRKDAQGMGVTDFVEMHLVYDKLKCEAFHEEGYRGDGWQSKDLSESRVGPVKSYLPCLWDRGSVKAPYGQW